MAEPIYRRGSKGEHRFIFQDAELVIWSTTPDRLGRLSVDILNPAGNYLARDMVVFRAEADRKRLSQQAGGRDGVTPQEWEDRLLAVSVELDNRTPQLRGSETAAKAPEFIPLSDFLVGVDPRRHDLVEGLLERGCLYNLSARFKTGKTLLAMNLALAVARGGRWLGRKVDPGPVYWLQLEDSNRVIARRWQRMAGASPQGIHICRGPWKLADDNLAGTIEAVRGAYLVIVDPLIAAVEVQHWSDMTEVRHAYDFWRQVTRETNAVVLVSTHHRKMAGDDGDQVAGSHQAGAAVDGIIEMRKGTAQMKMAGNERRISFTGRDWADLDDEVVALDPETLVFEPVGSYRERKDEADLARTQADAQTLMAALDGKPMAKTKVRETLHWSGDRFNRALKAAEAGRLVHEGPPTKDPGTKRTVRYINPGPRPSESESDESP